MIRSVAISIGVIFALALLPFSYTQTNAIASTPVLGSKPWVVLLCKYSDKAIPATRDQDWWRDLLGDTAPGLNHYWQEASGGAMNITGSRVAGWYDLRHDEAYYTDPSIAYHFNTGAILSDCMKAADADIYFPDYYGIMVVVNAYTVGNVGGLGSAPGGGLLRDDYGTYYDYIDKPYALNWVPYSSSHSVIVHEMGHGYGIPHTGTFDGSAGSQWEMGGADEKDQRFLNEKGENVYGAVAVHPTAYSKDRLGWIAAENQYVAQAGSSQTLFLENSAVPNPYAGYRMVKVPFPESSTEYYTVEARRKFGYDDVRLPGEAVLIQHVDTNQPEIAVEVVDLDANDDINDAGAQWTVGEVFRDTGRGITISVDDMTATGFVITVSYDIPSPPYIGTQRAKKKAADEVTLNGTINTLGNNGYYRFAYWKAENIGDVRYTLSMPINSKGGDKKNLDHQQVSAVLSISELSLNSLYEYRLEGGYTDTNGVVHFTSGLERAFSTTWPAEMIYPADHASLQSSAATFSWNDVHADYYRVMVKTSNGEWVDDSGKIAGSQTTWTTANLPTDGSILEVTLYTYDKVNDVTLSKNYTYYSALRPAVMLKPAENSTLGSSSVTFKWNKGNAQGYGIWVDTANARLYGNSDIDSGTTSLTVDHLPSDGSTLYVTLWTHTYDNLWLSNRYTYTAYAKPVSPALMQYPANHSKLTGISATFTWSDAQAQGYRVMVKTAAGELMDDSGFIGDSQTAWTPTRPLPADGSLLYVSLMTYDGAHNQWLVNEYSYTAYKAPPVNNSASCSAGKSGIQAGLCSTCHGVVASDGTLIGGALVNAGAMGDGRGKTQKAWITTIDRMVLFSGAAQLGGATADDIATYLATSVRGACP